MQKRAKREFKSRVEIRKHLVDSSAGSLSKQEYCKRHAIPVSTFNSWQKRYARSESKFIELPVFPGGGISTEESRIEICLQAGIKIRLKTGFEVEAVKRLVEALRSV